jgi:rubrerythrin
MRNKKLEELLGQALETERGGIRVYESALRCVVSPQLKTEWEESLEQTRNHERVLLDLFDELGLDPDKQTPGRDVVQHLCASLVKAMDMARAAGAPSDAQVVAAECVVLAENKDHLNWELIGEAAKELTGTEEKAFRRAHEVVEDEEDEHLYHAQGWTRELWLQALGFPAVLPPPEVEQEVKTALSAARARADRRKMP